MKEIMKGITYEPAENGGYGIHLNGAEIGFVRRTGNQWTARLDGLGGWFSHVTRGAATESALEAYEAQQVRLAAEAERNAKLKAAAAEHDAKMDEHAAEVAAKRAADEKGPFDVNLELAIQARALQGTLTPAEARRTAPGNYDTLSFTPAMDGVRVTSGAGVHIATLTKAPDFVRGLELEPAIKAMTPGGAAMAYGSTPKKVMGELWARCFTLAGADWANVAERTEARRFTAAVTGTDADAYGPQCGLVNLEGYRGYVDSLPVTAEDVEALADAMAAPEDDGAATAEAVVDAVILVDEKSPGWYDMRTAVRDHLKNDLAKIEGGYELDGPWRLTRLTVKLPTLPQTFEVIVAPAGTRMRPNRWVVITKPETCEAAL